MVVFRVDGNSELGMGHYTRCFAIAHELKKRGENVCFLLAPDADDKPVREQGYYFHKMKKVNKDLGWDAKEAAVWLKAQGYIRLFIDTYRINQESMALLASIVPDTYYLDDVYAFDYQVPVIINYNLEAKMETYKNLLTWQPKLYLGGNYYPIRNEILHAKVKYLRPDVRRILIITGSTDPLHIGLKLLAYMVNHKELKKLEFVIQCGLYYDSEYIKELEIFQEQYKCVKLQGWSKKMGDVYASCDICISSGSSTMSEAMTVGIPCISFAFVDNHLNQCRIMDEMGMAPYAGDFRYEPERVCLKIENYLLEFLDIENRNFARAKYAGVFDGKGATRIAKLLMAQQEEHPEMDCKRIISIRASAIIYNFIRSNHIKGTVLMPANICECVPAIYKKAGLDFVFCDIEFGTWLPNENEILFLLSSREDITVLHYNRTYGEMGDHSEFFQTIRERFPSIIIVDDRCLAMPDWQGKGCWADLTIYSTGNTKPVCVGKGAFAFMKKSWRYERHHLEGDIKAADTSFDASIKRCHAEHKSAEWDILLANWLDPAQMPEGDYEQKVLQKLPETISHKKAINEIYINLSNSLPEGMHNWRYNILVRNQNKCLQKIFQKGLFASKHYLSLGNGYFSDVKVPNCDWLSKHIINLFNDDKYTIDMARQTAEICEMAERQNVI